MEQVLIVTGGSRGIGAATALLAGKQGYAICVNYLHNQAAAQNIVDELGRKGVRAIAVAADIADENQVNHLFEMVDNQLGRVTALVNNAGILEEQMRVENMDVARLNWIFAANVTGSFLCARKAIKRVSIKQGGLGGAIVNVSSVASRLGSPSEYVDYAASKRAIDSMTIGLSKEIADEGIRVNAVRPGFTYTNIHADKALGTIGLSDNC